MPDDIDAIIETFDTIEEIREKNKTVPLDEDFMEVIEKERERVLRLWADIRRNESIYYAIKNF